MHTSNEIYICKNHAAGRRFTTKQSVTICRLLLVPPPPPLNIPFIDWIRLVSTAFAVWRRQRQCACVVLKVEQRLPPAAVANQHTCNEFARQGRTLWRYITRTTPRFDTIIAIYRTLAAASLPNKIVYIISYFLYMKQETIYLYETIYIRTLVLILTFTTRKFNMKICLLEPRWKFVNIHPIRCCVASPVHLQLGSVNLLFSVTTGSGLQHLHIVVTSFKQK